MVKRGLVIRTCGDPQIANAIASGMVMTVPDSIEMAKLAVREQRDRRYWQAMIDEANEAYSQRPSGRFSQVFWGVVGLVCYTVSGWYRGLSEANRRG